jgi:hypothetical protein
MTIIKMVKVWHRMPQKNGTNYDMSMLQSCKPYRVNEKSSKRTTPKKPKALRGRI